MSLTHLPLILSNATFSLGVLESATLVISYADSCYWIAIVVCYVLFSAAFALIQMAVTHLLVFVELSKRLYDMTLEAFLFHTHPF